MNEAEAREWFHRRDVPRETIDRLEQFSALIAGEQERQNLISVSTMSQMWSRHFLDSAQLIDLAPEHGDWIDLGSGPGLPGLVIALVGQRPVTLVESRAKRIAFLNHAVDRLSLSSLVTVVGSRLELVSSRPYGVISARAFAPLPKLLRLAERFAARETTWLLPKGRSAQRELEEIGTTWQGDFRIVPSLSDPESAIIVASHVRTGSAR